jgi:CRISPR-associated endonuclease/helicase Cas3
LFALLEYYDPDHPALAGPSAEVMVALGRQERSSKQLCPPTAGVKGVLKCPADRFDLLVYLVASHHGKVRVALHAAPKDQDYKDRDGQGLPIRGVRDGDRLPAIAIEPGGTLLPEVSISLEPAAIGLSIRTGPSWRERCIGLLERFGPAGLAYLESIIRAADVRASRLKTNDPELNSEPSA